MTTPGQVLAEEMGYEWAVQHESAKRLWEQRAAAVIAHHVGPDSFVVDRSDLATVLRCVGKAPYPSELPAVSRLLEALS